jgi:type I restriction enzyme S subunit
MIVARLGDYIREECIPLGTSKAKDLRLIGVSNDRGLHASSRDTSDDLSRSQCIEKDWFAYNPMRVNVGSIGLADDETKTGFTSPDYTVFSCRKGLDPHYLLYFLKSDYGLEAIARNCSGAVRKRLYYSGLSEIELPIPSMDEQLALVARISSISDTISFVREQNSDCHELPRLKQAILQEATQGKLTTGWRATHPNVEPARYLLQRIQAEKGRLTVAKKLRSEKPLPKIARAEIPFESPKSWEWCRVADIGIVIGGLTKNAANRSGHKRILPYLRVANVYANLLDLTDLQEIGVADSEVDKLLLEKDDLLVVEGNGSRDQVGRIALWDGSVNPCLHQNHVIKVRLGERKVASWALYWFLSPSGRALIGEQARTSTGLYNLSTGKVAKLPIPLPPLTEQAVIVERVKALMTTCRALEAEIEHSRIHADHLLQAVLKEAFAPTS